MQRHIAGGEGIRPAQRAQGDVYVFTGPVFSGPTRTIGPGKVQVPSHLFKLVYDASTGKISVLLLFCSQSITEFCPAIEVIDGAFVQVLGAT